MLDLFRKRGLTSVVYGVIIISIVVVFVLQFRPSAGQRVAPLREACAASVKGSCIDPKDLNAAYRALAPRDQSGAIQQGRARSMGLRRIALDGLIERELLIEEAERFGLSVSDDDISQSIFDGQIHVSLPSDNPAMAMNLGVYGGMRLVNFRDPKTKEFDLKIYERMVRGLVGRSPTEFREEQGRELLAAKMRGLVRAPVRVSDSEALESYTREKSTATLSYVPVKTAFVARYLPQPTAAQVDTWAKEKANSDAIDAQLKTRKEEDAPKASHNRHILVRVSASASPEDKAAALAKLALAVQRIQAGEPFAEVARSMSDDTGSAMRGGDVGDKTDGFVTPFKNAADALKPGETTSGAVETQFGYHLIRKDDPSKPLDEAALKRSIARDLYLKEKAVDGARALANAIEAGIKAGKTPDDAVKDALIPFVKPGAALPTVAILRDSANKADGGAGDAKLPAAKALSADTDPDRPQAQTSSAVNRGGDPIPELTGDLTKKVVDFAFTGKTGEVMPEPLRTDTGFVVVQLKESKAATTEEFDKDRDVYLQTLLAAKQAEALSLYVKRLRDASKASIKIDETFLDQGGKDGGAPAPAEEDEE